VRQRLKRQAFALLWKVNGSGQVQVERKEETQRRLGAGAFGESGSPDGLDALNLAYCEAVAGVPEVSAADVPVGRYLRLLHGEGHGAVLPGLLPRVAWPPALGRGNR
jgi:hypothetical protein